MLTGKQTDRIVELHRTKMPYRLIAEDVGCCVASVVSTLGPYRHRELNERDRIIRATWGQTLKASAVAAGCSVSTVRKMRREWEWWR